ncbi:MAG: DNA-protecting protein DprA [Magnetococcales bacterium]|nr:DNA-protecting protein DprA [Magnetococcales bacterium]
METPPTELPPGAIGPWIPLTVGVLNRCTMETPPTELLIDWLRLIRSPRIGPVIIAELITHLGSPEKLLTASRSRLSTIPGIHPTLLKTLETFRQEIPIPPIANELQRLHDLGGQMLMLGMPDYPPLLAAIHDPPPALFVIGHPQLLHHQTPITITGTRWATPRGQGFARELAKELTRTGIVVMSGLSRGIDAAAHLGAMETEGTTVAVLATGLDVVHPREHQALQQQIARQGCLVSEAPLGLQPISWAFPPRARILSGLTRGVVIVEAPEKSGALLTARMALEQGREVFAVPGAPNDSTRRGNLNLLRQGARLVENAADILEELHWNRPAPVVPSPLSTPPAGGFSGDAATILTLIEAGTTQEDDLARCCQLTVTALSRILLHLELSGLVQRAPGGHYLTTRPG